MSTTLAERIVILLVAACLAVALMLVTTSCAGESRSVAFTFTPKAPAPWCYIDELPAEPELKEITSDQSADVIDRVMVHRRDYAETLAYLHDVRSWSQQVRECLGKLTE